MFVNISIYCSLVIVGGEYILFKIEISFQLCFDFVKCESSNKNCDC